MGPSPQAAPADAVRPATSPMRCALDLAEHGPVVDPNPRVGCVLLDADGRVAGTGHHRGAGTPHAEVAALADARASGRDVRGGTAHVTLEPCAHVGRTGPCVDALAGAGIARVVYAQPDPGVASGGGAAALAARGVDVVHDAAAEASARALTREWTHAVRLGRPFVTWKTATSLDGRVAAPDGTSRWITGPAARADVHALRARCGAIVVGTGTALADDPSLTVRLGEDADAAPAPLRVVAGDRDLPAGARLRDDAAPTLAWRGHDPAALLAHLHGRQIRHVLLEGGPTLAAAFLRAGLVDEIVAYVAPVLLGAGRAGVGDLRVGTIADAHRLDLAAVDRVGDDVRLTLTPRREAAAPTEGP